MRIRSIRVQNLKSIADSGQLELGPITLLTGRNNSGKSTIIKAIGALQSGLPLTDVRFTQNTVSIKYEIETTGISRHWPHLRDNEVPIDARLDYTLQADSSRTGGSTSFNLQHAMGGTGVGHIPTAEPNNLIYPFLAKRKVTVFEQVVDRPRTLAIPGNLSYLVSKVARLSNMDHVNSAEYTELCQNILGFRVSAHASPGGQQAGISVNKFDYIPIEDMGEGVPHLLGLISDLCIADGNIFLIEELENDIHPVGLKALLDAIAARSNRNQFIISTHSNIVLRWLGSIDSTRIYNMQLDMIDRLPTTTITPTGNDPAARAVVLEELGYELQDLDLWEGWLFLEESSAERIIRDILIPLFTPRLTRIRLISVGGTSKAEPTFEDFNRLFRFAHLHGQYHDRAWVQLDGDPSGVDAIEKLRSRYTSWSADRFATWPERDFEAYYPSMFSQAASDALKLKGEAKRAAKKALLLEVVAWSDLTPKEKVKEAFGATAADVLHLLQSIDRQLFGATDKDPA